MTISSTSLKDSSPYPVVARNPQFAMGGRGLLDVPERPELIENLRFTLRSGKCSVWDAAFPPENEARRGWSGRVTHSPPTFGRELEARRRVKLVKIEPFHQRVNLLSVAKDHVEVDARSISVWRVQQQNQLLSSSRSLSSSS